MLGFHQYGKMPKLLKRASVAILLNQRLTYFLFHPFSVFLCNKWVDMRFNDSPGFSSIKNKQAHLLSHLFPLPSPAALCWCAEADLRSQFRPEVCVCDNSLLCCGLLSYWPSLQKKLSCCWPPSSGTGQRWGSVTEACRQRVSLCHFSRRGSLPAPS